MCLKTYTVNISNLKVNSHEINHQHWSKYQLIYKHVYRLNHTLKYLEFIPVFLNFVLLSLNFRFNSNTTIMISVNILEKRYLQDFFFSKENLLIQIWTTSVKVKYNVYWWKLMDLMKKKITDTWNLQYIGQKMSK